MQNIEFENKYRNVLKKKELYDSLDDEEIEDQIDDSFYINPESNFILIFDGIILFISLYSLVYFPFYFVWDFFPIVFYIWLFIYFIKVY